jgi:hypothetical protein
MNLRFNALTGLVITGLMLASTAAFAQNPPPPPPPPGITDGGPPPPPPPPADALTPDGPAVANLDGTYFEVSMIPDDPNDASSIFSLTLSGGQSTFADTRNAAFAKITSPMVIMSGAQNDYLANPLPATVIPAGATLYRSTMAMMGPGAPATPVTLVYQTSDNTKPRIIVVMTSFGVTTPIQALYDASQMSIVTAQFARTQNPN